MKKALATAKYSDASMGQYSEKAAKDEEKQTHGFNKRKRYESNLGDLKREKEKQLKLFEQLTSKMMDLDKNSGGEYVQENSSYTAWPANGPSSGERAQIFVLT
ncbi:unnamed protein product [Didymodactylos carnosus]|uniref:Uncharacterized protein n=1 Tax=Didymodactylos carnosus TaxID=1234261 RepID=A0A8S2FQ28_9BILA|nr:unnamed protein product [Didymodactylos carnosus]CAF4321436.1 unnamed protein product [Didymodactylos carnosus]